MREQQVTTKPRRRRRIVILSVALSLLAIMALPLTGYLINGADVVWAADEKSEAADGEAVNQRAEYWRAVRQGTAGYTAVQGQETAVLIQNGGENWRSIRNGPLSFLGGLMMLAVVIVLAAKHLFMGKARLETRTGRKLMRWSMFERIMHWYVAVLFIVLAVTGLSLLFGRTVLIPLLGKEGFAAWAQVGKTLHDYLSLPFLAGLALMMILWFRKNLLRSYDLTWLKSLGGVLGNDHPPAGFVNAGEKMFYWLLFIGGIAMAASGVYLLFPNMGWERDTMQLANLVHAASGLFLIAITIGHIYLGSIGTEGALEGMIGGAVDEGFARQHHNHWHDEVKGAAPTEDAGRSAAPGTSTAAQT